MKLIKHAEFFDLADSIISEDTVLFNWSDAPDFPSSIGRAVRYCAPFNIMRHLIPAFPVRP